MKQKKIENTKTQRAIHRVIKHIYLLHCEIQIIKKQKINEQKIQTRICQ